MVICPLLSIIIFRCQKFSGKQKGSFTKIFDSVLWDKKFRQNCDAPPPMHEKFRYWNSLETQKGSSTNFIGTVRQKFYNGVQWYPLPVHKILRYAKFSETTKCSPTKFFGTMRQKLLNEKSYYPLFCIKYRNQWWNWCL